MDTRACCVTEHLWIEVPVLGQRNAELDVLGTSVVGVLLQFVDAEAETVVPLQWAAQLLSPLLNICVPEARIKNESFYVAGEKQRSMHLGLDVVVQQILVMIGLCQPNQ